MCRRPWTGRAWRTWCSAGFRSTTRPRRVTTTSSAPFTSRSGDRTRMPLSTGSPAFSTRARIHSSWRAASSVWRSRTSVSPIPPALTPGSGRQGCLRLPRIARRGAGHRPGGSLLRHPPPKSNAAYRAFSAATKSARDEGSPMPPRIILNAPTRLMEDLGYGRRGTRYDHDTPAAFSGHGLLPRKAWKDSSSTGRWNGDSNARSQSGSPTGSACVTRPGRTGDQGLPLRCRRWRAGRGGPSSRDRRRHGLAGKRFFPGGTLVVNVGGLVPSRGPDRVAVGPPGRRLER